MNTIAFITAVNDTEKYTDCVKYILALNIPKNVQILLFPVFGAKSMAEAYNLGMSNNLNAQYKVYLHQDLRITDTDFLVKMINAFDNDDKLEMLGVVGCEKLPSNGIWWEGKILGQFTDSHTGVMQSYSYNTSSSIQYVDAIDGCIMCTATDIYWDTDFNGWHFYDISQCARFRKNGYKIGVLPSMIVHNCGICNMNGYEEARKLFVKNYLGE